MFLHSASRDFMSAGDRTWRNGRRSDNKSREKQTQNGSNNPFRLSQIDKLFNESVSVNKELTSVLSRLSIIVVAFIIFIFIPFGVHDADSMRGCVGVCVCVCVGSPSPASMAIDTAREFISRLRNIEAHHSLINQRILTSRNINLSSSLMKIKSFESYRTMWHNVSLFTGQSLHLALAQILFK